MNAVTTIDLNDHIIDIELNYLTINILGVLT